MGRPAKEESKKQTVMQFSMSKKHRAALLILKNDRERSDYIQQLLESDPRFLEILNAVETTPEYKAVLDGIK